MYGNAAITACASSSSNPLATTATTLSSTNSTTIITATNRSTSNTSSNNNSTGTTAGNNSIQEKSNHQHYIREFRVDACPLFKQHQCQQHRPFTCFYWHFANQRRRPPTRRPDGSFSYSADVYCDKYDENSGICVDGDSCPLLHRVAGDVERKYHPRYYKTAFCVHATDNRGVCSKNGQHCAFAHSAQDLRQPQFDIQEVQNGYLLDPENRDRTSFVVEDPVWHDHLHVLSCYKTEPCKKPARLCRQGYACPYYHNAKDRRRPPAVNKYRSTPCPAAKSGDEWLEPDQCEKGDDCVYCHTRTEQQFHPEIYKSTKCNDMLEHAYCPRSVFCAFAHHDSELHLQRTPFYKSSENVGLNKQNLTTAASHSVGELNKSSILRSDSHSIGQPGSISLGTAPTYSSVLKHRQSIAKTITANMDDVLTYSKAPGYERVQISPQRTMDAAFGRLRTSSLNMGQIDLGFSVTGSGDNLVSSLPSYTALNAHPRVNTDIGAPPLPQSFEELSLNDLGLTPISECREHSSMVQDLFVNTPISSSSSSMPNAGSPLGASPLTSFSESLYGQQHKVSEQIQSTCQLKNSFMNSVDEEEYSIDGIWKIEDMEKDMQRRNDELCSHQTKINAWEEGFKQARKAYEVWKHNMECYRIRAEQAEADKVKAIAERDQALMQLEIIKRELHLATLGGGGSQPSDLSAYQSSGNSYNLYTPFDHDEILDIGGLVCARCGRDKRSNFKNPSCRLCS